MVVIRSGPPTAVKAGVWMIGASLVVGALDLLLQNAGVTSAQTAMSSPAAFLFGIVYSVVFLLLILKKHNWARWVFVILGAIGLIATVPILAQELGPDPVGAISTLIQMLLQSGALVSFVTPPANRWFQAA